jgi:chromosome partitioning protein
MQTIALISQKGGAGKTTLAVHLAVAAHLAGLRVAMVDLDPQATCRKWGDKRGASPEVASDHAERLAHLMHAARLNGVELLVIDSAPNADRASLAAARAADLILIPCRPAAFDLEAIEATRDLCTIAKKPSVIVINAAPIRSLIVEEARTGLEAQGAIVSPIVVHGRVAFSHAVIDGRTAMEYEPDGKAASETLALYTWARQRVGLPTCGHVVEVA